MKTTFLPEGRLLDTEENRAACSSLDALRRAMAEQTVVEGMTLLCRPDKSLSVRLGQFMGVIPREEGAIGVADGSTREIALLTRVGKPICAVVTDILENGTLLLSRRKAQELARGYFLSHLRPGDVIPATVTHLEPFGAFLDIGCGLPSMLGLDSISLSRIPHPNCRFLPGQNVFAVVTDLDRTLGRVLLSHKELLGTWEENVAAFSVGMTVPGVVRGIKDYGTFVELTPNLSGLAEPREPLSEGERVSVFIKSILPERMKIKLLVIGRLPADPTPAPLQYYLPEGRLERWQYAPPGCAKVGSVSVFTP